MTHQLEAIDNFDGQYAELYGHLFENDRTGVARGVYWLINVKCKPIHYAGRTWEPGIGAEWLRLNSIGDLDQVKFTSDNQDMGECSFYVWQHDPADKWEISIQRADADAVYRVSYRLDVDFFGVDGDDIECLKVSGTAPLRVGNMVVVRDNLFPKPNSHNEARAMIEPFFPEIRSWSDFVEHDENGLPIKNPWRYCFSRNGIAI